MGTAQRFFERLASQIHAEAVLEHWWVWAALILGVAYLATRKPGRKS